MIFMWKDFTVFSLVHIIQVVSNHVNVHRFVVINAVMHRRAAMTLPGVELIMVKPFGEVARLSTWPSQARCQATVFPKTLFLRHVLGVS
jgi:hypothetical protein